MSESQIIFQKAESNVQAIVKKVLSIIRKNRTSRGPAVDKQIVREIKEISK